MREIKNYLYLCLLLFLTSYATYSQNVTATLSIKDGGPTTVCAGTTVTILVSVDPPTAGINYQWFREMPGFVNLNDKSGVGDEFTSIEVLVNENSTFGVQAGSSRPTISITTVDPPNAGIGNTVTLCNKSGSIDLFSELGGNPDSARGRWEPELSSRGNTFVIGTDEPGSYTYIVDPPPGNPCNPTSATIIVRKCVEDDYDNDGVKNDDDLDDDNDGILDTVEDALCNNPAFGKTAANFAIEEDFGRGPLPTQNANVSPILTYNSGIPSDQSGDGQYNVATSSYYDTVAGAGQDVTFVQTNITGNLDADMTLDGRYLAINMKTGAFQNSPLYEQKDLPIVPGREHIYEISLANLSDKPQELPPVLNIRLIDNSGMVLNDTNGNPIDRIIDGTLIPNGSDRWENISFTFLPPVGITSVTVQIINRQTITSAPGNPQGFGNDFGIDNIFLYTLECDFDQDGIPNSRDLDSDNDGIPDFVEAGLDPSLDADGDGRLDGPFDSNGVPISANGGVTPVNTDGTGQADYFDIDADDDGILDSVEGLSTADHVVASGVDGNFDGWDDAYDAAYGPGYTLSNIGGDPALPDYLDPNSDGDCITDIIEGWDTDFDGIADTLPFGSDTDNDGLDDAFDTVERDRVNKWTNATENGRTPADYPDDHSPGGEPNWREEYMGSTGDPVSIEICETQTPTSLLEKITGAAIGGTWAVPAGAPALTGDDQGIFDPAVNIAGTYTYGSPSLPASTMCPPREIEVSVTILPAPNAGEGKTVEKCTTEPQFDLFRELGGTPDTGGEWTFSDGTVLGTDDRGTFDPGTNTFGEYTYTVISGDCEPATAIVTVESGSGVNAGENGEPLILCSTGDSVDLFTLLEGTPDTNGIWSPELASRTGVFNPAVDPGGIYTYTVAAADGSPCPDAEATIEVTVNQIPELVFTQRPVCAADRGSYTIEVDLTGNATLAIVDDAGMITTTMGVLSATTVNGNEGTTQTITVSDIPADQNITISATHPTNTECEITLPIPAPNCNCPNINEPTNPISQTICEGNTPLPLSVILGAGQTAQWYTPEGVSIAGATIETYTPTDTAPGIYTYLVEALGPAPDTDCPSDRIPVTFTIERAPIVVLPDNEPGCDVYILPPLEVGSYFTEPDGAGTRYEPGDELNASQTLYIFASVGTEPNTCTDQLPIDIVVNTSPVLTPPDDVFECSSYTLPALTDGEQYFTGPDGSGEELIAGTSITDTQEVYIFKISDEGCASNTVSFMVNITPTPFVDLGPDQRICVAPDGSAIPDNDGNFPFLSTGLNESDYTFEWFRDGQVIIGQNLESLEATVPGQYTVAFTDINTNCTGTTGAITVFPVQGPESLELSIPNGSYSNRNRLIATVEGDGEYEYSLNDGPFQSSNVFENAPLGPNRVIAQDIQGCGFVTAEIFIIGFPNFFTPNNDSFNDTWNVIAPPEEIPPMKIYIYDRYGKLLKQLDPFGLGWDGTYNGKPLPATDYWYRAIREDGQGEFKNHFTLKR